jgi:hypothetical protein
LKSGIIGKTTNLDHCALQIAKKNPLATWCKMKRYGTICGNRNGGIWRFASVLKLTKLAHLLDTLAFKRISMPFQDETRTLGLAKAD